MELIVKDVRYEDGLVVVVPQNRLMARTKVSEAADLLQKGKQILLELPQKKRKRSLDANAYAWVLIDKISAALRLDKVTVYRDAIRDIAGNRDTVTVANAAVDKLSEMWELRGTGWFTEILDRGDAQTTMNLVYGSSTYTTEQMSTLIDHLVQDAKELGIETLPPEKLAAMTERWG